MPTRSRPLQEHRFGIDWIGDIIADEALNQVAYIRTGNRDAHREAGYGQAADDAVGSVDFQADAKRSIRWV